MSVAAAAFQDGLGERRQTTGAGNQLLDLVLVHEALGGVAGFEAALRQRSGELASFTHASFPRLKGVGKLSKSPAKIVVATDHVSGVRLSDLLAIAERRLIPLEYDGAVGLVQQLLAAVAALHEAVPHVSHGAIATERLMFTPDARLMVVDHSFGAAIACLGFSQERCWKELRAAYPVVDGKVTIDRRADVMQIGAVALSLLLGRLLNDEEYPAGLAEMIEGLNAVSSNGLEMLPSEMKSWLRRALQLDAERSFVTAVDAKADFEKTIKINEARSRTVLTAFLSECQTFGKAPGAAPAPR
jgi:serine/threonine protein kinase